VCHVYRYFIVNYKIEEILFQYVKTHILFKKIIDIIDKTMKFHYLCGPIPFLLFNVKETVGQHKYHNALIHL
jgi:hypothetical protein